MNNTDTAKVTQYTREAQETKAAAEAGEVLGEFAYIVRAASEFNNK